MASGPFKIRLKLPKPGETKPDPSAEPGKERKKKRKRTDEPRAEQEYVKTEDLQPASQPAGRIKTEQGAQPSTGFHQSGSLQGRDGPTGNAELSGRPRLVIKGSFGGSKLGAPQAGQPGADEKRVKEKKLHKEKKKKRHKDRIPGNSQATQEALPVSAAAPVALPAKVCAPSPSLGTLDAWSQPKKEEPTSPKVKQEANLLPPAKPKPLLSFKAESQAPSGLTGFSGEGTTQVSSRPGGTGGASGQEAVSSSVEIRPGPGDVEALIGRLQKRDPQHFFRDPVTDAVAPGYSAVIKRPMSFSQMQGRLEKGEYGSWKTVQEDLETMFNNAMVFNGPLTNYHQKAREMMGIARKLLQNVRTTGQLDGRSRKSSGAAKPPTAPPLSAPLTEKRTERRLAARPAEKIVKPKVDKKKAAAKKAAQRAAASGVLARPGFEDGRGDYGPLSAEENVRSTFPQLQAQPVGAQWGGLARGASAEGVEFGAGRPTFRPNFLGSLTLEQYSKSLRAFGTNLSGWAKKLLDKKLAAAAVVPPAVSRPVSAPIQQPWAVTGAATPTAAPQVAWNPLVPSRPVTQPVVSFPAQPSGQQAPLQGQQQQQQQRPQVVGQGALQQQNPPFAGLRPAGAALLPGSQGFSAPMQQASAPAAARPGSAGFQLQGNGLARGPQQ